MKLVKYLLIITLLIVYWKVFGKKSFERYDQKGVTISTTYEEKSDNELIGKIIN